jgi:hypothetical protein
MQSEDRHLTGDEIRRYELAERGMLRSSYDVGAVRGLVHRVAREVDSRDARLLGMAELVERLRSERNDAINQLLDATGRAEQAEMYAAPVPARLPSQVVNMLARAQTQADRVLEAAHIQARREVAAAQQQAQQIVAQARADADRAAQQYRQQAGPQYHPEVEQARRLAAWYRTIRAGLEGTHSQLGALVEAMDIEMSGLTPAPVSPPAAGAATDRPYHGQAQVAQHR